MSIVIVLARSLPPRAACTKFEKLTTEVGEILGHGPPHRPLAEIDSGGRRVQENNFNVSVNILVMTKHESQSLT